LYDEFKSKLCTLTDYIEVVEWELTEIKK
jgi:hypothetical protein